MKPTDLRLARQGDRDALARLLATHEQRLMALATSRLGDDLRGKLRISDILQSTYMEVLRDVDRFAGTSDEEFTAWVGRVLENNIRDKGKYFTAAKRAREEAEFDDRQDLRADRRLPPTPLSDVAIAEEVLIFRRALEALSPEYREIIELRLIEDRPYEDIAMRLGRTVRACQSLLARSRARLVVEFNRILDENDRFGAL